MNINNEIEQSKYNELLQKICNDIENSKTLVFVKEKIIDTNEILTFIKEMTKNYSDVLGYTEIEILSAMECERKSIPSNYYNSSIFPLLDEKVKIFENVSELFNSINQNKFICPCCKQIQVNPYTCESGYFNNDKQCDLSKNAILKKYSTEITNDYKKFRFTIRNTFLDKPMIDDCFLPIEFQNTIYDPYFNVEEGA